MATIRTALLFCLALSVASITPAQAGQSSGSVTPTAFASLPQVAVPELLDPQGEPILTDKSSQPDQAQDSDEAVTTSAPALKPSGDLAAMVAQLRGPDAGSHELACLATGIYFESKGEPLAGQLAVGKVIANRAASAGRFPPTYCGVLFQRGQFSFVHGHALPSVPRANKQWQTAVALAKIVDQDLQESSVGNALFFHARYVSPGWHAKRVASIGNHIFYR
ncbi:MAG TPA: cell wall hydrolase [Sphingomicrobium sp.]|nr:cell wall hydrolase [Sphingomicrobium sp.]